MQKIGPMMEGSTFFVGNKSHRAMDKKIKDVLSLVSILYEKSLFMAFGSCFNNRMDRECDC